MASKKNKQDSPILIAVKWDEKNKDDDNGIGNNREFYDEIISSGSDVASTISTELYYREWEYVPYNFERINRLEELKKQPPFDSTSFEDLCSLLQNTDKKEIKTEMKKIKKAYEKVSGDLNSNSMTLYSGMHNNEGEISVFQGARKKDYCLSRYVMDCCPTCYRMDNVGCLYTGDYDASKVNSFEGLKKKYSKYWDSIKFIQVPHHGAKRNFNSGFLEIDKYFIISVGLQNIYNHPSIQVISDILLFGGDLLIVTENSRSIVQNLIRI